MIFTRYLNPGLIEFAIENSHKKCNTFNVMRGLVAYQFLPKKPSVGFAELNNLAEKNVLI
jgi:hypothetical protein